jgi:hypothetical protein
VVLALCASASPAGHSCVTGKFTGIFAETPPRDSLRCAKQRNISHIAANSLDSEQGKNFQRSGISFAALNERCEAAFPLKTPRHSHWREGCTTAGHRIDVARPTSLGSGHHGRGSMVRSPGSGHQGQVTRVRSPWSGHHGQVTMVRSRLSRSRCHGRSSRSCPVIIIHRGGSGRGLPAEPTLRMGGEAILPDLPETMRHGFAPSGRSVHSGQGADVKKNTVVGRERSPAVT